MEVGTTVGPYRVEELIGRGGMAEVYKVWHNGLHRYEALKVLPSASSFDASFVERFLAEARFAARLHHPHIVTIHAVSEASEPPYYFTMQLVEGGDLADLLNARHRLPMHEVLPILRQIAGALDHAHQHGVVHRDVKPGNIRLDSEDTLAVHRSAHEQPLQAWNIKVVDFGIARAQGEGGTTRLTQAGMFVGTPEYMSPEQAGSGAPIDQHTDIYALGIIAYEMLCGRPPFRSGKDTSPLSVVVKHLNDKPPSPQEFLPSLPDATCEVILRALSKEPSHRFPSCSAFVDALSTTAQPGLGAPTTPEGIVARPETAQRPESPRHSPTVQQPLDSPSIPPLIPPEGSESEGPVADKPPSGERPIKQATLNTSLYSLFNDPESPAVPPSAFDFPEAGKSAQSKASVTPAPESPVAKPPTPSPSPQPEKEKPTPAPVNIPPKEKSAGKGKGLIAGAVVLVCLLGGFAFWKSGQHNDVPQPEPTPVLAPDVVIETPKDGGTLPAGEKSNANGTAGKPGAPATGVTVRLWSEANEEETYWTGDKWDTGKLENGQIENLAGYNGNNATWFWAMPPLKAGEYRLRVTAKDASGKSKSEEITFKTVASTHTAPPITHPRPTATPKPTPLPAPTAVPRPTATTRPAAVHHSTAAPPRVRRTRRVRQSEPEPQPVRRVRRRASSASSGSAGTHRSAPPVRRRTRSIPRPSGGSHHVPRPSGGGGSHVPRPD